MAALYWQRSQEVTDNLVDLLIQIVHKLSTKAERRVSETLTKEFKRVEGKQQLLDSNLLQKRLLLCLYALGTNTGLKRIGNATPDVNRDELRYIKRRFIHKDHLRLIPSPLKN